MFVEIVSYPLDTDAQMTTTEITQWAFWKSLSAIDTDLIKCALLLILIVATGISVQNVLLFTVILAVLLAWEMVFSRSRNEPLSWRFLYTVCLLTLLVPSDLPLSQVSLCVAVGVLFGEQVFGGRAHSFLSAVVVTLAFVFYAFSPTTIVLVDELQSAWLLLPLIVLLAYQQIDWLTLFGTLLGIALTLAIINPTINSSVVTIGLVHSAPTSLGLCLLFILSDKNLAARTRLGKILGGALLGLLSVYLNPSFADLRQLVFSLLLTAIAIPLIDHLARALSHHTQETSNKGAVHEST